MAYTVAQLDALKSAYAKGVMRVKEADLDLEFASGADMLARIKAIESELGSLGLLATAVPRRLKSYKATLCP